ncbi:LacI family transcriptional regulator [Enterococcus sp. JM4C]|uniref:LacI family DNA-binding transcriptional regulator n=1 Tax=Candidatus Enterococcus huntleyi TaxID=1857217 RepID=UPI00137B2565|nr:LacI family DNA-binding transcriptional regulator [Enterococcus sp. JM4C]KAF1295638.1 LacI family transcriptional regulator [Enterococcus sp. JM4C]
MANIRDIARLTGYSVSTISRVINNYPYVDEIKRRHVRKVMKELNYVPNSTARNLSIGKTRNVGVILPFTNHPYFDQVLSGIMQEAFLSNYKVTLLPTNYEASVELDYLTQFAAKEFDGLIITSRANSIETLLDYQKYGPLIFCEEIKDVPASCVYINRTESIREGLLYLKNQGYTRVGVTLGRSRKLSQNSKITVQLCHEVFPEFTEEDIYWDCLHYEDGLEAEAFLTSRNLDAVFCNGDQIAAGILRANSKRNRQAIVGRDNLLTSELLHFSTIDHQLQLCGKTAFQQFHQKKMDKISIPYTFIERK